MCYKEEWCLPLTQGEEVWENYRPELIVAWGRQKGTGWSRLIDFGLSSSLMEMMKLLAHGLRNRVHFQDNQTTVSLSTSLTWFAKEIIDDSCSSFEAAVVF